MNDELDPDEINDEILYLLGDWDSVAGYSQGPCPVCNKPIQNHNQEERDVCNKKYLEMY